MIFTTIQSSAQEKEIIRKTDRYPVKNNIYTNTKINKNDMENILINPGIAPSNNTHSFTNTIQQRNINTTNLVARNRYMRQFLANGRVGNGCSSCSGAR